MYAVFAANPVVPKNWVVPAADLPSQPPLIYRVLALQAPQANMHLTGKKFKILSPITKQQPHSG